LDLLDPSKLAAYPQQRRESGPKTRRLTKRQNMKKLFGHPDSGHAYKVRLFMVVAGIEHTYEYVDIFAPRDQRQPEFMKHARYHEVPLLLDGDRALVQSGAILMHLAEQTGRWGAESPERWQKCREWIVWEANKIGLCLPQLLAHQKFESMRLNDGAHLWLSQRYDHDVQLLDGALADGRKFILGDEPSIADFSLSAYLFLADAVKLVVPSHVQAWLGNLAALPGWQKPEQLLARS